MLNLDFLPLYFACLEAMDPMSLIFASFMIFTIKKGSEIDSSPDFPFHSSLLLGSLTCFGVTDSSSVLKSYWLNS